jgi:hypothetical protein
VSVLPTRVSRTQDGAEPVEEVLVVADPPTLVRRTNADPLPGVTPMNALREPLPSVSRIITPASAPLLVFSSDATRATISPSPVSGW